MADRIWRYDDMTHRAFFGTLLAPLVAAAGSLEVRNWRDEAYSRTQLKTWMLALGDVAQDILEQAIDRIVMQGVTWMPRPGDVRAVCCDLVDERRQLAARQAKALQESCGCSEGWRDTERGVVRCACHTRALELVRTAGDALARPALPPSTEEVV